MSTATIRPIANTRQLVEDVARSNSYGLIWCAAEDRDVMFQSQLFTLPNRDSLAAGLGVNDRPVYDVEGEPIPGSLLLEDLKGDEDSEVFAGRIVFDAKKAVTRWLGLPERFKGNVYPVKASVLYAAGLRLLSPRPTKAEWRTIQAEGIAANEDWLDEMAKQEIAAWHRHRQRFGADAMSPDDKYDNAVRRLKRRSSKIEQAEAIRLGLEESMPDKQDADLELEIEMRAALMKKAEDLGVKTSSEKTAIVEDMLKDPSVRKRLQKSYLFRKRGQAFEKPEALDEAVQAQVIEEARKNVLGKAQDEGVEGDEGVEV